MYANKQQIAVIFCGSPSNIDNRSVMVVHAKFDARITHVTIISLSNWIIPLRCQMVHPLQLIVMFLYGLIISPTRRRIINSHTPDPIMFV